MRWLATGLAAAVLSVVIAWALAVPAADWLARHDVGSATGTPLETARNNARGSLLTLGAGAVAAGALIFTARNFALQRRTLDLSRRSYEESAELARRTFELTEQSQRRTHQLTEQGQVSDRYTKAIEQLGSEKIDIRIGGIYALERIARDSARDHPTVMEVLAAFIREHSREQWPKPELDATTQPAAVSGAPPLDARQVTNEEQRTAAIQAAARREIAKLAGELRPMRPDVEAAVSVIKRRDDKQDILPIDLVRADLTGAILDGAKLIRADLRSANLTDARLMGADLTGAKLFRADLRSANLADATLSKADLTDAKLRTAFLYGATLTGAMLPHADLTSATLARADLTGAHSMRANLTGADLTGANLIDANLIDANLNGADFTGANLNDAIWPSDAPVPEGWALDPGSGRLKRTGTAPAPAGEN